eukprot:GILJ01003116.1.p1 GENE.GILJ01003116.1~~GILJ01003116.1.p1  ORF type:complete len:280 (+),score=39.66 GILJ01003116.1:56-841(+)
MGTDELSRSALTPTTRFLERLAQCPQDKEPFVLLTTGSFCPIHKQHVNMQREARGFLENNFPAFVVTSYLSPSSDTYVERKLFKGMRHEFHLTFEERALLCQLATSDDGDIEVDRWEGSQPKFIDFETVTLHLQTYLNELSVQHGLRPVRVCLSVGVDMLKCGLHLEPLPYSLVVVHRAGFPLEQFGIQNVPTELEMWRRQLFFAPTEEVDEVSSSLIHRMLTEGRPEFVKALVHEKVGVWIQQRWKTAKGFRKSKECKMQ